MTNESKPRATTAGENRQHIFIISYGRTGSTLLMALLSNHRGILVRGENSALLRQLRLVYENLRHRHDPEAFRTSDAFFGAHAFTDELLLPWIRGTVERFLLSDCVIEHPRCVGFKEIYFSDPLTLRAEVEFLRKVFPRCLLVFNTRNPEQVARSEFNAHRSAFDFEVLNREYRLLADELDGIVVDYADLAVFGPQTRGVFQRLEIVPDDGVVLATLGQQQGYVTRKVGAKITRVPFFVHPCAREDVEFIDVQSVTRFDAGVVVVSGGIVADRPIEAGDWFVTPRDARIVRSNFGILSEYYLEDFTDQRYSHCGFVVEIAIPDGSDQVELHLFGNPLLQLRRLTLLPLDGSAGADVGPQQPVADRVDGVSLSRVPKWVRPYRRADLSFLDVQSVVRFDNGVVVISGGFIANTAPAIGDFSVTDPRGWIVNFRGGLPSKYYASHYDGEAVLNCGFALEVMTSGLQSITVNLFDQSLFDLREFDDMPLG